MTSVKICIISIIHFIIVLYQSCEKSSHCPWFDMMKLRHSTEEMKAVAEENGIINSLFPDGERLLLQAVSVSVRSVSLQGRVFKGNQLLWGPAPTLCADRDVLFQPSCCLVPEMHQVPSWGSFVSHCRTPVFWLRIVLWCEGKHCWRERREMVRQASSRSGLGTAGF